MVSSFGGQARAEQGAQSTVAFAGFANGDPVEVIAGARVSENSSPFQHTHSGQGGLDPCSSPRKRSSMDQGIGVGSKRVPATGFHMASPFMAAAMAANMAQEHHSSIGVTAGPVGSTHPSKHQHLLSVRAVTTDMACVHGSLDTRAVPAISTPILRQDLTLQQQVETDSDQGGMLGPVPTSRALAPAAAAGIAPQQLPIVPAQQPAASGAGLGTGSSNEWELDMRHITVIRRLAVGGFAEVFLGRYQGTLVAIKRLFADAPEVITRFAHEVRVLARLRHPNLILFIGYTLRPEPCIISEYMSRGSLFSILRQRAALVADGPVPAGHTESQHSNQPANSSVQECSKHLLEPKLQRSIAMAVARGMAYLHTRSPPIVHLDLKSPNILVDHAWRVKIADFGLSTTRQHTWVSSGNAGGTPEWMAPEVLRCEKCDEKADVYSYGVILWELLTGQVPWQEFNPMQVVGQVGFAGRSLAVPDVGDPVLRQLCRKCMSSKADQRPSFPEVVQLLDQTFGSAAAAVSPAAIEDVPGHMQPVGQPPALPAPAHDRRLALPTTARAASVTPRIDTGTTCDEQAAGTDHSARVEEAKLQGTQVTSAQQPLIQEPPSSEDVAQWHVNAAAPAAGDQLAGNQQDKGAATLCNNPGQTSECAPMECSQPPSPSPQPGLTTNAIALDACQMPVAQPHYTASPFAQQQQHGEHMTRGISCGPHADDALPALQQQGPESLSRPSLNGSMNSMSGRSTGVGMRRKARSPVSSPDERMLAGSSRIVAQKLHHYFDINPESGGKLPPSPRKLASRQYAAQQQMCSVGSAREHQPLGRASAPARTSSAHHSPPDMLPDRSGSPPATFGHHRLSNTYSPTGGLLGGYDEAGTALALPAFRLRMSARTHRRSTSFTGLTRQFQLHAAAKAAPAAVGSAGSDNQDVPLHITRNSRTCQGETIVGVNAMHGTATLQHSSPGPAVSSPGSHEDVDMWDSAGPAAAASSRDQAVHALHLHDARFKDRSFGVHTSAPFAGPGDVRTMAVGHWLPQQAARAAASPRCGLVAELPDESGAVMSQEGAVEQEGEEEAVSADAICSPGLKVVGIRPPRPGMGPCRRAYSARYNMTSDGTSLQHMAQHQHGRVSRAQHRRTASDDGFITNSIAPDSRPVARTCLTTVESGVVDKDSAILFTGSAGLGHGYPHSMDAIAEHMGGPLDIPRKLWHHPGLHEGSVCTDITFRSLIGSCASSSAGGNTPGASTILNDFSFLQQGSHGGVHLQHAFSAGLMPPVTSQAGASPSASASVWGEHLSMRSSMAGSIKRSMDGGSLRPSIDIAAQHAHSALDAATISAQAAALPPIITCRAAAHGSRALGGARTAAASDCPALAGASQANGIEAEPCTPPHSKITSHPLSDLSPVSPFQNAAAQGHCVGKAAPPGGAFCAERRARRQLHLPPQPLTQTQANTVVQHASPFEQISTRLNHEQQQVEAVVQDSRRVGFALPETCTSPVLAKEPKEDALDEDQVSACSPDVADLCAIGHVLSKANASRTWKSGRFKVTDFDLPCSSPPASPSPAASADHPMMHVMPPVCSSSPINGRAADAAMQSDDGHVAAGPQREVRAGSEPALNASTLQRTASMPQSYLAALPGQQCEPLPGGGLRAALTAAAVAAAGTAVTHITPMSSVSKDDVDEGECEGQHQQASSCQQGQLRRTSTMMYRKGRFFVSSTQLHVDTELDEGPAMRVPGAARGSHGGTSSATPSNHSSLHVSRCPTPTEELPMQQHNLPFGNLFSSLQQPLHHQQHLGLVQLGLGLPAQSAVGSHHQTLDPLSEGAAGPCWSARQAVACHMGNSSSMPEPHAQPAAGGADMPRSLSAPGPPPPCEAAAQVPPIMMQRAYQKGRFDVVERVSGSVDNLAAGLEAATTHQVAASCSDTYCMPAAATVNAGHTLPMSRQDKTAATTSTVTHDLQHADHLQQEAFSGSMDVWLTGPHALPRQAHHPSPLMATHSVQVQHVQQHVAEPATSYSSGGGMLLGPHSVIQPGSACGTPGAKRVGRFTIISDGPASPTTSPAPAPAQPQPPVTVATASGSAAVGVAWQGVASLQEGCQLQRPPPGPTSHAPTRVVGFALESPSKPPQGQRSISPMASVDVPMGERRTVRAMSRGRFLVIEEPAAGHPQHPSPPRANMSTHATCGSLSSIPTTSAVVLSRAAADAAPALHISRLQGLTAPNLEAAADTNGMPLLREQRTAAQQQLNTSATPDMPVVTCEGDDASEAMEQDTAGTVTEYQITVESNAQMAQELVVDVVLNGGAVGGEEEGASEEGAGGEEEEEEGGEQMITVRLWQQAAD